MNHTTTAARRVRIQYDGRRRCMRDCCCARGGAYGMPPRTAGRRRTPTGDLAVQQPPDLTHASALLLSRDTIHRPDDFFSNINFDCKRMSGLAFHALGRSQWSPMVLILELEPQSSRLRLKKDNKQAKKSGEHQPPHRVQDDCGESSDLHTAGGARDSEKR